MFYGMITHLYKNVVVSTIQKSVVRLTFLELKWVQNLFNHALRAPAVSFAISTSI
jgi:hypothetical protein